LVVTITNSKEEVAAYRLYNFAGKRIAEKTIYLQKGVNTIKISELANLVPGTYHLQVVSANQTINKKVVKMD
jgi:Fe2+ transport system protein B